MELFWFHSLALSTIIPSGPQSTDSLYIQTLSQSFQCSPDGIWWSAAAIENGSSCFHEILTTDSALQLTPPTPIGMSIRDDIPKTQPTMIWTVWVVTIVIAGIHRLGSSLMPLNHWWLLWCWGYSTLLLTCWTLRLLCWVLVCTKLIILAPRDC